MQLNFKMTWLRIICLSFTVSLISCKHQDKLPETYINRFYKSKGKLEQVVEKLKKDTLLDGKFGEVFKSAAFDNITRQKLKNLGVDEVNLFSWGGRQRQFGFKTDWRDTEPIHLCYNTLDSIETVKGFYRKDKNNNEVWGLGYPWLLWVERKLIDAKQ
jgi:hypothetical protein